MTLSALYESTKSSFAKHQSQGKRYHYPAELKEAALKLLSHYSAQNLSKALGITDTTLHNWLKAKQQKQDAICTEFVPVSITDVQPILSSGAISHVLTITLPHGLSLILPEQPVSLTAQLIGALVKELASCSI